MPTFITFFFPASLTMKKVLLKLLPRKHLSWSGGLAKNFSRRLAKMSSRRVHNVFNTSSRHTTTVKLVLITKLQDIINTFSRRLQNVCKKP